MFCGSTERESIIQTILRIQVTTFCCFSLVLEEKKFIQMREKISLKKQHVIRRSRERTRQEAVQRRLGAARRRASSLSFNVRLPSPPHHLPKLDKTFPLIYANLPSFVWGYLRASPNTML